MSKPNKIPLEEFPDGEKHSVQAFANELAMPSAPFTPKSKATPKKKKTGK